MGDNIMSKKKISIVIPCYNEEENVAAIASAVKTQFATVDILKKYDYDIIFMDNASKDATRDRIREAAETGWRPCSTRR